MSLHEYGHYIADRIDIEANPGGPHSGEDNLSDARGSKSIGVRLAFGEGWPTYFAVSALRQEARGLGIPHVGDVFYDDTEDQVIHGQPRGPGPPAGGGQRAHRDPTACGTSTTT